MKEADAAQASNLGQALGPAIAGRFQELTQRRYETVQLTAQLATEGIVVSGALRPTEQISVGTREQLSTLYRLSLAEYLSTTIVLDDQLVQSDDNRMDWFRALLTEKARSFQILVFTCRPSDYLAKGALVPKGSAISRGYRWWVRTRCGSWSAHFVGGKWQTSGPERLRVQEQDENLDVTQVDRHRT